MGRIHHQHVVVGKLHLLLLNHRHGFLHAAGGFGHQHHGRGCAFALQRLGFHVHPRAVDRLFKHLLDFVVAGFVGGRVNDFALLFFVEQRVVEVSIHTDELNIGVVALQGGHKVGVDERIHVQHL